MKRKLTAEEISTIHQDAQNYVRDQLATMKKYGMVRELTAEELSSLVDRVMKPVIEVRRWTEPK